jgi:hypothetical protein
VTAQGWVRRRIPKCLAALLLAIWIVVWALMRNPDLQIVRGSYSDELAQAPSREGRQLINEHGDYLGFRLSADQDGGGSPAGRG